MLLIQRGQEPSVGRWSVPGGRCRARESTAVACVREVAEETGLRVRVTRLAGRVERAGSAGTVYDIEDFVCVLEGGTLAAGDDAADAMWATRADLDALPLVPGLLEALREWDCLPR
jgi:8-oxo-dGTP diphosphatase